MFARQSSSLFSSLSRSAFRNFCSFPSAQLKHTFIPCKGNPVNEPFNLIALHGVLGSGMNFNQIVQKADISSKVNSYLLDLRNHGQSEHKDSMSYPEMASDVYRFMQANKLERKKNILLGFSMGARVAMEIAVTYPELIQGVALVDLAPHDYPVDKNFVFVDKMDTMLEKLCEVDLKKDRNAIKKDIMAVAFNQEAGEVMNSNVIPCKEGGYQWRLNLQSIYSNFKSQIISAKYRGYDTYAGPVKIIFGAQSEYTSKELIPSYHQLFENFDEEKDFVKVEGAGHSVHYNQPNEFIKIMSGFINQVQMA